MGIPHSFGGAAAVDRGLTQEQSLSMYAVFASIPLIGHLNPLLRQAEELSRRGWRVALASTTEARSHVEGRVAGVSFIDLGPQSTALGSLEDVEAAACRNPSFVLGGLKMMAWASSNWTVLFDGLQRELARDRPAVVIADLASAGAMDAAEAAGVPMVVNNPFILPVLPPALFPPRDDVPFLFSGTSIHAMGISQRLLYPLVRPVWTAVVAGTFGRELNRYRRTRNLPPIDVNLRHRDDLVLVNSAFGLEYRRALPPTIHMVGPMLPPTPEVLPAECEAWLREGPPVVFANLGTVAVASAEQVRKLAAALTSTKFRTLWVLRGKARDHLPSPLPPNMRVENWVPLQLGILGHPNVRVFLSHCGVNSIHESIAGGTPIVGIPMLADQLDMAVRVQDAGAGVYVDKRKFTVSELATCIERVLTEASFRDALPALQSSFRLAGGVPRAVDLIEHFARFGIGYTVRDAGPVPSVAPSCSPAAMA